MKTPFLGYQQKVTILLCYIPNEIYNAGSVWLEKICIYLDITKWTLSENSGQGTPLLLQNYQENAESNEKL